MARSTSLLIRRQWALRDGREQGRLWGVGRFLRTNNVLSARPDLKRFTSIRFRMTMKRHPSDSAGDVVLALLEAIDLDPPLSVFCGDFHLEMEGYPIEEGCTIEVSLLPPGRRPPARGFELRWSGFSGQGPWLTFEAGHRP